MLHARPSLLCAFLLAACGPAPATTADADTSTTATSDEASATGGAPSSTGPGPTEGGVDVTTSPTSTGGTTSATSTGEGVDTIDTCGFICPDTEPQCQVAPGLDGELRCTACDAWTQDCPQGQKCNPWADDGGNAWNALKCVEVAPNPRKPGEPCTVEGSAVSGIDDCERGAMCWDVDPGTLMGTCVGLCDGSPRDPSCAEPETVCLVSGASALSLCLPTCDPVLADCPEGQTCLEGGAGTFFCITVPDNFPPGGIGAPCEFAASCDPGLACISSELVPGCEASGCCSPFCKVSAPNTCPDAPNQVCRPWYEQGKAPEGLEDLGVCALP